MNQGCHPTHRGRCEYSEASHQIRACEAVVERRGGGNWKLVNSFPFAATLKQPRQPRLGNGCEKFEIMFSQNLFEVEEVQEVADYCGLFCCQASSLRTKLDLLGAKSRVIEWCRS